MNPDREDGRLPEQYSNEQSDDGKRQQLVRRGKLILYNRPNNPVLDESVVSINRYSSFGTNLFPGKNADLQLAAGVTSAGAGDGKTMVAANLASFFALDTQDDTVLIDLNFRNPQLHEVFGVSAVPGISESLRGDTITLSRSAIKGLWILPLGAKQSNVMSFDMVIEMREVISTLKRQFRFVVVDLPSAFEPVFPTMLNSHLDGYFVVVTTGRTKKTEINELFNVLNENKVIGFVMNRVAREK